MNERIRELMVKAGMQFRLGNIPTHISFDGTHTFNEYYVYDKFDPEKFAELIVADSSDVANKHMELNEGTDYNVGGKIKQHFGVDNE
jgi:hypothetical protein